MNLYFPFQWAPTLGGECYTLDLLLTLRVRAFQWAPTLGGECYPRRGRPKRSRFRRCFNGHPPLGVNATQNLPLAGHDQAVAVIVSMGTHPWG